MTAAVEYELSYRAKSSPRPRLMAAACFAAFASSAMPAIAKAQEVVIGAASLPRDLSPWGMYLNADPVVKAVLIGLVVASFVTWTACLAKGIEIWLAMRDVNGALRVLTGARSTAEGLERLAAAQGEVKQLVEAAAAEQKLAVGSPQPERVEARVASRLERIETSYARRIARGTGVLATVGATAPFIGLFGTVWGIMNSFIGISKAAATNLAIVAPGIAEALLATAFGLAAAIPAVVIYNVFARIIGSYRARLGDASAEVLRIVGRELDHTVTTSRSVTPVSLSAAE